MQKFTMAVGDKVMYKTTIKTTYNELLSILFFILLFTAKGFGLYDGQRLFNLLIGMAAVLLAIKLLGEKYSLAEILICSVIGILMLYNYRLSYDKGLLLCMCMFLMVKNCRIEHICKVGACVWGITGIFNFLLSMIGIHEGRVVLHSKLGGEILRYSFGQPHPNILHLTYFIFCCLFLYSLKNNRDRLRYWNRILFVGNLLLFLYTISYTSVILGGIFYLGIAYLDRYKEINWMDWVAAYGTLVCTLICSIVIPILLDFRNDKFQLLNKIFHTRTQLLNQYFEAYSVTAFGQWILDYTRISSQLDNSWATLYLGGGVILFTCVCVLYAWGLYYFLKQKQKMELLIMVCLLLGGVTESFLFNTSLKNIGLLFLGTAVYEKTCRSEKNKIVLFPKLNRGLNKSLELKIPEWNDGKLLTMRLAITLGIIALPVAWLITNQIDMPQSYYVSSMDYAADGIIVTSETVTDEIRKDASTKVYNYAGDGGTMWHVNSERIRRIEYIRTLVGIVIGIYLAELAIVYIVLMLKEKRDKECSKAI